MTGLGMGMKRGTTLVHLKYLPSTIRERLGSCWIFFSSVSGVQSLTKDRNHFS